MHKELSETLLGLAFKVHGALGPGLAERCYQKAFRTELETSGIRFENEKPFPLHYRGVLVGNYRADLVVEGKILLELKAVRRLLPVMAAQTINYLRLSHLMVGYLLNFNNKRVEWKRFCIPAA